MFQIRKIYDVTVQSNQDAVKQVQSILRIHFPQLYNEEVEKIPEQLNNPLKYRFRPVLFVAENAKGIVKAFALMLHVPDIGFCFLDFLSAAPRKTGSGLGGILYERVRAEAYALQSKGLFFECLPDDPKLSPDPHVRKQNARRLQFYERYDVRPVVNTAYETPFSPQDDNPPYLMYDHLKTEKPLRKDFARAVVRAILERKYSTQCPPGYIQHVVDSIVDEPVKLRPLKYVKIKPEKITIETVPHDKQIVLVVNQNHTIHHVHDRGYVEAPVRISSILRGLNKSSLFQTIPAKSFPERHIRSIHDHGYIDYFKKVCHNTPQTKSLYPYVFPIRNATRPPRVLSVRAGYYCIDTFTPLNKNAYLAAKGAVDCALTGAHMLLKGTRISYALVRPPGHHAERKAFGGFCYFNSSAIAANFLSRYGKVALLDIDYHHGNGQQDIFYERPDVLTVSIHCHPRFAYPYFSGFIDEKGKNAGIGYNLNIALGEQIDGQQYIHHLGTAIKRIRNFKPLFLVVSFGLDTARGDPTGSWSLNAKDFYRNGTLIGQLHLPTLIVQEGGYDNRVIGSNARNFFTGLWKGMYQITPK